MTVRALERPGIQDDGVGFLMDQHEVEHIERIDRPDAFDQRGFAVAVQCLQGEAAGVDLAALVHEALELIVEVLCAGERLVADLGEAALDAEGDAGSIQEDGRFISFAGEADRLKDVHEADGAFERDGVESDESLLAGFGFETSSKTFSS